MKCESRRHRQVWVGTVKTLLQSVARGDTSDSPNMDRKLKLLLRGVNRGGTSDSPNVDRQLKPLSQGVDRGGTDGFSNLNQGLKFEVRIAVAQTTM